MPKNDSSDHPRKLLGVVGLGASAGGHDAINQLLTAMPTDSGLALVIISHLAPAHTSRLAEIVQRQTPMAVVEATDLMPVEPDCVYIIPPNREMRLVDGCLRLAELPPRPARSLPIDLFMRSLAEDQKERAVCIILSGTGTDGTLGLAAVKEAGGLVIAQAPDTAAHPGMPESAISTGMVDHILPPAGMPDVLVSYALHPYAQKNRSIDAGIGVPETLPMILKVLHDAVGHDFSGYKPATIGRRVERRMALHRIEDQEAYLRYLTENQEEAGALFRDMLIGVTSFFRDQAAFAALEALVIPKIVEERDPGDPIRVWVPACTTGEETYSIAMLLKEYMEASGCRSPVQIFATDIDDEAVARARLGVYPPNVIADISAERLRRFFVTEDGRYRVTERVRAMVVFATQSVIKDPPFCNLDLISCRNLLIYLDATSQAQAEAIFAYALKPDSFLFLGTSEDVDAGAGMFTPVDTRNRIYRRSHLPIPERHVVTTPWVARVPAPQRVVEPRAKTLEETVARALLTDYAPPCVAINDQSNVVYIHGRASDYLELVPGDVTRASITQMAREGLDLPLATAIREARSTGQKAVQRDVVANASSGGKAVDLIVQPLRTGLLLVVFAKPDARLAPTPAVSRQLTSAEMRDEIVVALERELQLMREYAQGTAQEQDADNEELQSMNEELQSANEELQTSREELQSVNEELVTVNAENMSKIHELTVLNSDLDNLLNRLEVGIIFVDRRQQVRRFNSAATRVSNLIPTDVGRPLEHIVSNLVSVDLAPLIARALDTLGPVEVEVTTVGGRSHWMCIRPYLTARNMIDGVMMSFTDITELRGAQQALAQSQAQQQETERVGGIGGWSFDIKTRTMAWTDQVFLIYDAPLSARPGDVMGGEGFAHSEFERAIVEGVPYVIEDFITTSSGNVVPVRITAQVEMKDGRPERVYGYIARLASRAESAAPDSAGEEAHHHGEA